jgi:hypothetical protein
MGEQETTKGGTTAVETVTRSHITPLERILASRPVSNRVKRAVTGSGNLVEPIRQCGSSSPLTTETYIVYQALPYAAHSKIHNNVRHEGDIEETEYHADLI